jgi:hypothetical protein
MIRAGSFQYLEAVLRPGELASKPRVVSEAIFNLLSFSVV